MSKFHSTVTRRDFMKGLGLAGAGIGGPAIGGSGSATATSRSAPATTTCNLGTTRRGVPTLAATGSAAGAPSDEPLLLDGCDELPHHRHVAADPSQKPPSVLRTTTTRPITVTIAALTTGSVLKSRAAGASRST